MRSLLFALAIADLIVAVIWGAFWLRERHLPRQRRVRTTPLTPVVIVLFLAQAGMFWLNATKL